MDMIYKLRQVMAKNTEIKTTKKVQPERASLAVPKTSTPVNFTFKALPITASKNAIENKNIRNKTALKKVVKEDMATKSVLNLSEKLSYSS